MEKSVFRWAFLLIVLVILSMELPLAVATDNNKVVRWWEEIAVGHQENIRTKVEQFVNEQGLDVDIMSKTMAEYENFLSNLNYRVREELLDKLSNYWYEYDKAFPEEESPNPAFIEQNLDIEEQRAIKEYLSERLPERILPTSLTKEETEEALNDVRELLIIQLTDDSFKTMGKIPASFNTETGKTSWYKKLSNFAAPIRLNRELYYPNGPIFSHGVEITGYFVVELAEDKKDMVDDTFLNKLYNQLQKEATSTGIDELPVLFRWSATGTELHGYDSTYTSIPGGVSCASSWQAGTTNIAARNVSTGALYYIVAGHLGPIVNGLPTRLPSGTQMYQPNTSRAAGTNNLTAPSNGNADAARVSFSDVRQGIHTGSGTIIDVNDYFDPILGQTVFKSGRATGITFGTVKAINKQKFSAAFGTLFNQVEVDYNAGAGDSGAPVYYREVLFGQWHTTYYGSHAGGTAGGFRYFTPYSGIRTELSVVPLIK